jgi:F-type H+-transporting ATPase subunit epsilon
VANTFPCKIVTPNQEAFTGEATYVSFPAWDGQYGMMKGLAPLLSTLSPGSLRIDGEDGRSHEYLLEGGFAHIDGETLTFVTEGATFASEINLEEAKAELAEANARVTTGTKDRAAVERAQQIAMAKVAIASKS